MENRSDIEKRLGEKLEAAYMLEEIPQGMSREDFHRLIQAAEKKKKRRRNMLSLAAACVALCLVCGGFVAGMTLGESATAGKDDETKTVQQGGSVVIGSGVSENDQNVGMSTKTYTNIEDIPEDIRKEIHFLDSDEFELEKVVVIGNKKVYRIRAFYINSQNERVTVNENSGSEDIVSAILTDKVIGYKNCKVYVEDSDDVTQYYFFYDQRIIRIDIEGVIKIEAVLDDLLNLE